ncbi:MAG: NAD(P)/FAD-dependent oxidoreductase [Erysipelotrichaceae bacterium]|nr:NAD(P)/FAD-dependent oxidoreductase [Erysipelotrichaceae bacterium]
MFRIDEYKVFENISDEKLFEKVIKKYKINKRDIVSITIIRKSVDCRKKDNIHFSYSFALELRNEEKYTYLKKYNQPEIKIENHRDSKYSPIIIGAGPAGLFCALTLVENGIAPIIVEQGEMVDQRLKTVQAYKDDASQFNCYSNVQFGEGGAGTFSDGKLTTNVNSPLINMVLNYFVKFSAPKEILYQSKPHIGTDNLVNIMKNIREYIQSKGGKYYFNTRFLDYQKENGLIHVICDCQKFTTDTLVLAVGHSARNVYELLKQKEIVLTRKNFALGVRIEHLQKDLNYAQYGDCKLDLPQAEYKLAYHGQQRDCYSFCMCPGGYVVASNSEKDGIVTNGMSYYNRDNINCNSALLVNVKTSDFSGDDPLSGMYFQRELEHKAFIFGGNNGNAPIQKVGDFQEGCTSLSFGKVLPTYLPGVTMCDLNDFLPDFIKDTLKQALPYFDHKIKGFNDKDSLLTAIESRSSSPVTIKRNEFMLSSDDQIYPIGEGAGYAGGITTAAIDGIKAAIRIMSQ